MVVTLAYGVGAAVALLTVDAIVQVVCRRGDEATPGRRLLQSGRVLSLFLLAGTVATACPSGQSLCDDLVWMAVFGLAGMLALELAQALGFRALRGLADAARADNLAAATAATAHTIAIGILVANVAGGNSFADFAIAAISFAVGQTTLLVLVWLFRCLTAYDDPDQILGGNLAAALSHGGLTIALALLIAHATDGEYQGPWLSLRDYGIALAECMVVWPLRQLLVQCVILRARPALFGGELDRAIARGDVGAGALEGTTYIAVALFVRSLL